MPIYEYRCTRCGHEFELQVSLSDPPEPPVRCPKRYERTVPVNEITGEPIGDPAPPCAGECVRLISRTSFILKGSGWAKDGYGG